MKVLVTGASGFIGTHLCPHLLKCGHEVFNFDRHHINPGQFQNIDAVVHLAALAHITHKIDDSEYEKANYELTKKIVEQVKLNSIKKIIFISSIKVMGEKSDTGYQSLDKPNPQTAYAKTKFKAEEYIKENATNYSWTILRPPLVFGPGVKANFNTLIKIAKIGFPLPFKNLKNKRSYLYVNNFVDLIEKSLIDERFRNKALMVTDSRPLSTGELLDLLSQKIRNRKMTFSFPQNILKIFFTILRMEEYYQKFAGNMWIENDEALKQTSWIPPHSLEQAIKKTLLKS